MLFYVAALGSWYIATFFRSSHKWFCKITLNHKNAVAYFLWSSRYKPFPINTNKNLMFFSLKASWNFFSDKLILSCLVKRCKMSLRFNFHLIYSGSTQLVPPNSNGNLLKELRHPFWHLVLYKYFQMFTHSFMNLF